MGAQQVSAIQPERVLGVARGVIGRNVQSVEVVMFGLDFGPIQHREAERDEQLLEFALYARDGVQMAAARTGSRQCEVNPFGVEAGAESRFGEVPLLGLERLFELLLGAVEQFADAGALFGREFPHLLADLRQRAFAPQRFDANGLQFLGRARGCDARQGTGFQFLYGLIGHDYGVFHCSKWGGMASWDRSRKWRTV